MQSKEKENVNLILRAEFYPEVQQNLKIKTAQSICTVS